MRRFLAPVALVLLAACSDGAPAIRESRIANHEETSLAIGQGDQSLDATETTEAPTTTVAPVTTSTIDWGPVLCPSQPHPLHHRPCPPTPSTLATVPPSPVSAPGYGPLLACIRSFEGTYTTDTGNGHFGAYQFKLSTWASVGGSGNPAHAEPSEQDARAIRLYERDGLDPWPTPAVMCRKYRP